MRRLVLAVAVLAAILIPFALWEERIEPAVAAWLAARPPAAAVAAAGVGLLAADVVLPVPSSLVATADGALLGFAGGTLVNWAGLMAGSLLGYALGARAARGATRRWLGADDMRRMEAAYRRYGDWLVAAFRAVPVLAEASSLFAGIAGFDRRRYLLLSGASNLAVAALYAGIGAWALETESFLWAFGLSLAVPGIAMLATRRRET